MNDLLPLALAVVFLLLNATFAVTRGLVPGLAAGLALAGAWVLFLLLFEFLPVLSDITIDWRMPWKVSGSVGLVAAILGFVWLRVLAGLMLPRVFGPDSKLHGLVDGIPAAVLSLIPGLIVVLFLFTCFRVGATVRELGYVAALSQAEKEGAGVEIPPYPISVRWREQIEAVPGMEALLDQLVPLGARADRVATAVVWVDQTPSMRAFVSSRPDWEKLFEPGALGDLDTDPDIASALEKGDPVAILLHPSLTEKASDSQLSPPLETLHLRPVLEAFVASLEASAPSQNSGAAFSSN